MGVEHSAESPEGVARLFLESGLPIGREERFYTATVLPALISGGGFAGFETFRALACSVLATWSPPALDLADALAHSSGAGDDVQLVAEFDLWKALGDPKARPRFPDPPPVRAVPDLVIYVAGSHPVLIAVEAKMFHYFTAEALRAQMDSQKDLLDYVASRLGTDLQPVPVVQLALLPKLRLMDLKTSLAYPILTWEAVRDGLADSEDVTVRYWVRVLTIALNHGYLSPPTAFGGNKDGTWTGKAILEAYAAGDLGYTVVGRRGGLGGKEFTSDLVTGGWMRQRYEVAQDDSLAAQPNWFTVEEFVEAVRRRWLDVGGLQARLRAFAEERDWSAFHDPKNLSMALAAEVGELLEVFRWLTPAQSGALAHDPEKAEESAAAREEIADTLILLLQLADALEVDLQSAVEAKLKLNAERYPASRVKGDATKYTRRRD